MASADLFTDRLLAEAVRYTEEAAGHAVDAGAVETALKPVPGTVESRICRRATQLEMAPRLRAALTIAGLRVRQVFIVVLVLAAVAGAFAVTQAFVRSAAGTVNFFWLLISLLGLHMAALIFWCLGLVVLRRRGQRNSIARAALLLAKRVLEKKSLSGLSEPPAEGAVAAWFDVQFGGAVGRWRLSAMIHGIWIAYLLGGLFMMGLQLSVRQYDFVWETTILGERAFVELTRWLATAPALMGMPVPSGEQIAASRLGGDGSVYAALRDLWAGLLFAGLVVYGLLPRLLLLLLSAVLLHRAKKRFRLDLSLPYFVTLRRRLEPVARSLGVVDPAGDAVPSENHVDTAGHAALPDRPGYWVGVELDGGRWPPRGPLVGRDLGVIVDRDSLGRVVDELAGGETQPLVVVAELGRTPDKGLASLVARLVESHRGDSWLVLSGASAIQQSMSDDEVEARFWDWHRLAARAGIPGDRVVHLDLPDTREHA